MAVRERISLSRPGRKTVVCGRPWHMSATALAVLAAAITIPLGGGRLDAQGLTVTGYADFEAYVERLGSDDLEFYFDNHHVNLILLGRITGNLFGAVEVEYEHAGEEVALEYGYLGFTGIRDVRILAGKFIVPFGRFNRDLHPTPNNKIPFRPYGFDEVLPQTYNDVGVWVSMAKALTEDNRLVADGFVVNGLLGEEGASIRSLRDNALELAEFGRDDSKSVGARVGIEMPFVGLDFGGSLYTGKYAETEGGQSLNLTLLGLDAAYRTGGLTVRGEMVRASQEVSADDLTKTGGYLQASYMIVGRVEPVIQFSTRNMPAESADRSRLAFGASLVVSPASTVRLAYAANMEKSGFKSDNNAIVAQFNIFF